MMPLSFKNVSDHLVFLPELGLMLSQNEEVTLTQGNLYNMASMVYHLKKGAIKITHPLLVEFFGDIEWKELS